MKPLQWILLCLPLVACGVDTDGDGRLEPIADVGGEDTGGAEPDDTGAEDTGSSDDVPTDGSATDTESDGSGGADVAVDAPTDGSGSADAELDAPTDGSGAADVDLDVPADGSGAIDVDLSFDGGGNAEAGAPLYETYCGFCHGDSGEGYEADDANALASQSFLSTVSDAFLFHSTKYGRPGTVMSAWGIEQGGALTDEQVADIVAFIRQWQTEPSIDVDATVVDGSELRGEAVYAAACSRCHGSDGSGITGRALSLNNAWFHALASDGFIRHAIDQGRPPQMQAYGSVDGGEARLTGQEIDDLVAYLRTWATPIDGRPPAPFEPDLAAAVVNPDGDNPTFTLRESRYVPTTQVRSALASGQRLVMLDARTAGEYLDSHIAGATSLPFYDADTSAFDLLPRDTWIVTYCGCPHAVSGQLMDALVEAGFPQVAVLDEGYYHWASLGLPLQTGPERGTP